MMMYIPDCPPKVFILIRCPLYNCGLFQISDYITTFIAKKGTFTSAQSIGRNLIL